MESLANVLSAFTHETTTDNYVFRLHYKVTFAILIVCACIVGFGSHIGSPIKCDSIRDYPLPDINRVCWIQSTFTLKEDWNKTDDVLSPGVSRVTTGKTKIYHTYYQWVFFSLCLQSLFFYLPRCFWKRIEGGRIRRLTLALNSEFLPEEVRESKKRFVSEYLVSNMNNHQFYFACYFAAEIMNFANVVAQISFMDSFLGGDFSSKVVNYRDQIWNTTVRSDPLIQTFPRVTMCTIRRYGASGSVQLFSTSCILTLNHINEKIYVFLWCWFVSLAVLSALTLAYRAIIVFYPRSRSVVTGLRVPIVNRNYLADIIDKSRSGDWLILDLLSRNMDPLCYRDVINDFAQRVDVKNAFGNSISLNTRTGSVELIIPNSTETNIRDT